MKNKVLLFGLLAIVMGTFVVSSCSKDDDDEESIVGTWTRNLGDELQKTEGWTFGEDNSCTWFLKCGLTPKGNEIASNTERYGTYELSGNSLIVHFTRTIEVEVGESNTGRTWDIHDEAHGTYTYSISGNMLSLTDAQGGHAGNGGEFFKQE